MDGIPRRLLRQTLVAAYFGFLPALCVGFRRVTAGDLNIVWAGNLFGAVLGAVNAVTAKDEEVSPVALLAGLVLGGALGVRWGYPDGVIGTAVGIFFGALFTCVLVLGSAAVSTDDMLVAMLAGGVLGIGAAVLVGARLSLTPSERYMLAWCLAMAGIAIEHVRRRRRAHPSAASNH